MENNQSEQKTVDSKMVGFDKRSMQERNKRSYVLAGFLLVMVSLFFVVTLAKLGYWE